MKKILLLAAAALAACATPPPVVSHRYAPPPVAPAAPSAVAAPFAPGFKKVMIVILENTDYAPALDAPFLSSLTARGALLSNYRAISHPSEPNYFSLVAGDTFGITDDDRYDLDKRHLGDLLEAKGLTWAAYAEGFPGGCNMRMRVGRYARKHVPFISFKNVSGNPARCARVKPASELDADVAAGNLPDFSLYIPDMDDDGHDTNVKFADKWLAKAFGPRLDDPKFMKDLLLVVTFDEDASYIEGDNHIYAALVGDMVRPGATTNEFFTHFSLLRTVEDAFGLGDLGRNDAKADHIDGVWRTK